LTDANSFRKQFREWMRDRPKKRKMHKWSKKELEWAKELPILLGGSDHDALTTSDGSDI